MMNMILKLVHSTHCMLVIIISLMHRTDYLQKVQQANQGASLDKSKSSAQSVVILHPQT